MSFISNLIQNLWGSPPEPTVPRLELPAAPAIPSRPPTPEETAKAVVQLRVLRSQIDDHFAQYKAMKNEPAGKEPYLHELTKATATWYRAQALDPNATLTIETKDGPFTYTQSYLAAELLYLEADAYEICATNISRQSLANYEREVDAIFTNIKDSTRFATKLDLKYARKSHANDDTIVSAHRRKAIEILKKAMTYDPHNPEYAIKCARLAWRKEGATDEVKRFAQQALDLAPDNIDAIKCAQDMGIL